MSCHHWCSYHWLWGFYTLPLMVLFLSLQGLWSSFTSYLSPQVVFPYSFRWIISITQLHENRYEAVPHAVQLPPLPQLFKQLDWLQWGRREGGVRSGGLILYVCMAMHLCMCVSVCVYVYMSMHVTPSVSVSMSMYNITRPLLILPKCVNDILDVKLWMSRIRPVHHSQLCI